MALERGVNLPYIVPTTGETALEWCRRLDAGPFDHLAIGDRLLYTNIDQMVMLSAAAALTTRIRLYSYILLLTLYPSALVAKRTASIDVLSGGRLTVALGGGTRPEDYEVCERPWDHRLARLDRQVDELRRLWAGAPAHENGDTVGPSPVQPGGPPLLWGGYGPKAMARAARWADGYAGFITSPDPAGLAETRDRVFRAWDDAGRTERPRLMTAFFFALGEKEAQQLPEVIAGYTGRHANRPGPSYATEHFPSADHVKRALENIEAAGFDAVTFLPVTADLAELDRLEALLGSL